MIQASREARSWKKKKKKEKSVPTRYADSQRSTGYRTEFWM